MPNILANKILDALEPYIGRFIAEAGLKVQCTKIGKTQDTIDMSDLDKLSVLISGAMKSFGKDGDAIAQSIKSLKTIQI